MMRLWLASLTILALATFFVGGCNLVNQPPLVSSLTASAERVSPSGSCQVECVARDPDGDKLSYTWSVSGGSISGEGRLITWTAPETLGYYTIAVKVTDGRGGKATTELTIGVAVNQPPIIDSLTAEPPAVTRAMSTTIECTARDPDEDKLNYTWSASRGSVSGEGSVVTWVAPNTFGTYTITITVTDGRGGEATKSVNIEVTCCVKQS